MKEKPVVLVIDNSVGVTGAIKSITRTSLDNQDDFHFQFLIPSKSKARWYINNLGFTRIHELPMWELRKNVFSVILYLPNLVINSIRLSRIIKNNSVAAIHVNDIYNLLPVMNRLFGSKTPYICHIRFMPDRFPGWLFNFWFNLHLRYAHAIVAVSKSVNSQLPKCEKVTVVYDPLPMKDLILDQANGVVRKSNYTFLYLSNFIRGKGQDFAIEAFAKIHGKFPDWKLRLVGGDLGLKKNEKYRESLIEKAKRLGIHEKTEWVGFTNEVEVEYKQSDIVLNFSESESFSMTCLEALFFGRPLIATDSGGPSEILEGGKIGILVPKGDINSMADSMERLANDENERNQIGMRARTAVREKFSKENTSLQLKVLYEKIVNQ